MDNSVLNVTFDGGMRISATIRGFGVHTDQKPEQGGENSAPTPFELFFASLATCAGVFAKRFCDRKGISAEGLSIAVECESDPDPKKYRAQKITTVITLPPGFPQEYETALVRTVEGCPVKKQVLEPPQFETRLVR